MGTSTSSGSNRSGMGQTRNPHTDNNIASGNNFSTKYKAGKPLPAGDKNSGSYWQNLVSTDGGKTLHTQKAARLAKEHGYNSPAYTLDHLHERQKAGISDLDPAGFNTNFYKGSSWKDSKGKTHTIPSDQDTIKAFPKLLSKFVPGSLISALSNKNKAATVNKPDVKKKVVTSAAPTVKDNRFSLASSNKRKNKQRQTLLG